MPTLGEAIFFLRGDSSDLDQTINKSETATEGLVSRLNGFLRDTSVGVVTNLVTPLIQGLQNTIGQAVIGLNATLESSTLQFETLMGDADKARAHVEGLFEFAKKTPFETGPLIEASATMETFGGAALNTTENLKLFGDAAAGANKPIDEITFWSSRMYAALQAGKPIGEATQNLMQLGVVGPQVVTQLEALQESGASGTEIWEAYTAGLGRFEGAMDKQSGTWQGLTSSIKDTLGILAAQATKPIFDIAKIGAKALLDFLSSPMIARGAVTIATALDTMIAGGIRFGRTFIAIGRDAITWGQNIGEQLAAGVYASIAKVVASLRAIGNIISYWLRPGSPPKLLPDLAKWGQLAAEAWAGGWDEADIGAFDELSGKLETALKGLVDTGKLDKASLFDSLMGGRQAIARAINEMGEFGEVSQSTLDQIASSAGDAGPGIANLVQSYSKLRKATRDVDQAQKELNDTTAKYDAILNPLNAQLQEIEDKKKAIEDQQKLAELQATVADESKTEDERQIAALEIQAMGVENQITAVERERDTSVDAATTKLEAAKLVQSQAEGEYQQQQRLIEQNEKQNALVSEQIKLLEQLAKEQASAAGGGGGAGGGAGAGGVGMPDIGMPPSPLDAVKESVESRVSEIEQAMNEKVNATFSSMQATIDSWASPIVDSFIGIFDPWRPAIDEVIGVVTGGINDLVGEIRSTIDGEGGFFDPWIDTANTFVDRFRATGRFIVEVVQLIGGTLNQEGPGMWVSFTQAFSSAQDLITMIISNINIVVTGILNSLSQFMDSHGEQISSTIGAAWNSIMGIISTVMQIISELIGPELKKWADLFSSNSEGIQLALAAAWQIIDGIIRGALGAIQGLLNAFLSLIRGDWEGVWQGLSDTTDSLVNGIKSIIEGVLNLILSIFGTNLETLENKWNTAWNNLKKIVSDKIIEIKNSFLQFISDTVRMGADMVGGLIKGVNDNASRLVQKFIDLAKDALTAVKRYLGIASESKVFAKEVGENSVLGILKGMMDALPTLLAGAGEISDQLVKKFESLADEVSNIFDKIRKEAAKATTDMIRGEADALRAIQKLAPDRTELDKMNKQSAKLNEEQRKLKEDLAELMIVPDEETPGEQRTRLNKIGEITNRLGMIQAEEGLLIAARADQLDKMEAQQVIQDRTRRDIAGVSDEARRLGITDPRKASDFMNLRRKQILSAAQLQENIALSASPEERAFAERQLALELEAQISEMNEFMIGLEDQGEQIRDLIDKIGELIEMNEGPNSANAGLIQMIATLMSWLNAGAAPQVNVYGSEVDMHDILAGYNTLRYAMSART